MSTFSFSFDVENIGTSETKESFCHSESEVEKSAIPEISAVCSFVSARATYALSENIVIKVGSNDTEFKKIVQLEDTYESDIIPGVYEGGLKLWECSRDLADFVVNSRDDFIRKTSAIELGCGHGLPGIAALSIIGFSAVVFSDFNAEVLRDATWPNIYLNAPHLAHLAKCVSGDWLELSRWLQSNENDTIASHFDLILSAETLYCSESTVKVYGFLETHLAPEGIALIASKRYYFGVGGGTSDFIDIVARRRKLTAKVVMVVDDGCSNIREIIEVRRLTC